MEGDEDADSPQKPPRKSTGFKPTRWSLVRRAVSDRGALNEWIGLYWYPLYVWARQSGSSDADAADGVQSFLEKLCAGALLKQPDESRGRLRSWLLTAFRNHLTSIANWKNRLKRGGKSEHISIDWQKVEETYQVHHSLAPAAAPEAQYSRAWALTLMEEALEEVEAHFREKGELDLFHALAPTLDGPLQDVTFSELARKFATTSDALRQKAQRLKLRYRRKLIAIASVRLGIKGEARIIAEIKTMMAL